MDVTLRFSNRVENYIKYRPAYPNELYHFLESKANLSDNSTIADIGSGTGISSSWFVQKKYKVFGVEPNQPMREAAEKQFSAFSNFESISATAENTTLFDQSIDLIISAQAFHWFIPEITRKEFKRILKPTGKLALIWNERKTVETEFLKAYELFLKSFAIDYEKVDHRNISEEKIKQFFLPKEFQTVEFNNSQLLDLEGLKGRVLSSSYMPSENYPDYNKMIEGLNNLFANYADDRFVELLYSTRCFYGEL